MFGGDHRLFDAFPQYGQKIHDPQPSDHPRSRLPEEIDKLDRKICRSDEKIETSSDADAGSLEQRRLVIEAPLSAAPGRA